MQIAALSASSDRAPQLYQSGAAFTDKKTEARTAFFRQAAAVIGTRRQPVEIRSVLATLVRSSKPESEWWRRGHGSAQGGWGASARDSAGDGGLKRKRRPPRILGQDLLLKLYENSEGACGARPCGCWALPDFRNAGPLLAKAAATAESSEADP